MIEMDIRRATPSDADAMAKLHVDAWQAAYHGLVPDAFLAEQAGDLLGMLTIGACRDEDVDW